MQYYTPQSNKRHIGECDETSSLKIAEKKSNPDVECFKNEDEIVQKQVTDEETDSRRGNFKNSPPGTI